MKALMVDVDGVIVVRAGGRRWDHDLEADLGVAPARLQSEFFRPHWPDVVLGRADLHDRLAPVLAQIAPAVTSQAFADYWFARDSHLDHALLAELAALRAGGLSLHLATVQEHHRARHLWETLRLRERFEAIHYAADLGCAKPDPAFFHAIERRTGLAPADMALLDDSAANVEAACACGWRAMLWNGTQSLTEVVAAAG